MSERPTKAHIRIRPERVEAVRFVYERGYSDEGLAVAVEKDEIDQIEIYLYSGATMTLFRKEEIDEYTKYVDEELENYREL